MNLPKNFLKTFETILKDAAELFGRETSTVNNEQFDAVNKGRLSVACVRVFGYAALRSYVAPKSFVNKTEQKAMKDLIAKLVKSA